MPQNTAHTGRPAAPAQRFRPDGKRSFLALMGFFGVVFLAVMVVQLSNLYSERAQLIGDGRTVTSYGYDLSTLLVDRDLLVASGRAKDARPAVTELTLIGREDFEDAVPLPGAGPLDRPGPKAITAEVVDMYTDKPFQRPVVGSDRVIGLSVNGEARAYPVRYIQAHEIVNDTLGGRPVAVTYSVLCDSAVAFDRRVAGETLTFGFSGLVYNANLVMYDRRPDANAGPAAASAPGAGGGDDAGSADEASPESPPAESLWSQLSFKAIAGPAAEAGRTLDVLPLWHGSFAEWRQMHPETSVFIGDPTYEKRYERDDLIARYFKQGEVPFPIASEPPAAGPMQKMTPVEAFRTGSGAWRVLPSEGVEPGTIPADAPRIHARWFAWHAFHGSEGLSVEGANGTPDAR